MNDPQRQNLESETDESSEDDQEDGEEINTKDCKCGDYIVTYISTKNKKNYFVAQILHFCSQKNHYIVKYLKKKSN